jgi:hypothetical protein
MDSSTGVFLTAGLIETDEEDILEDINPKTLDFHE